MKKLFLTFAFALVTGAAMFMSAPDDAQAWWDDDDDWYDRPWHGGGWYRPYGYGYPYGGYGYPYGGGYYGGYPYGGYGDPYGYGYQQPQQGTTEGAPAESAPQPAYPAYPAY